jgi:hypothetical protein
MVLWIAWSGYLWLGWRYADARQVRHPASLRLPGGGPAVLSGEASQADAAATAAIDWAPKSPSR